MPDGGDGFADATAGASSVCPAAIGAADRLITAAGDTEAAVSETGGQDVSHPRINIRCGASTGVRPLARRAIVAK
jgi:hypothetical protein